MSEALIKRAKAMGLWTPLAPKFYDPERDGITFSVLNQFTSCRELARLSLNGVTSKGTSFALVFGSLVHAILQFTYEAARHAHLTGPPDPVFIKKMLAQIQALWEKENPMASAETRQHAEFSMIMAEAVIPRYFTYWKEDFSRNMAWLALEHEFKIPIQIELAANPGHPIKTFLRGKMDGNFRNRKKALRLFETKTQTFIDEETTSLVLPHELQVNIYLWAMRRIHHELPTGVLYNIIRRPALRQKKNESIPQFAARCAQDVRERPDFYFMRMDMDVVEADMDRFEGEFMDLLTDFLSWWYGLAGHYKESSNCRNRYGTCHMLPLCGAKDFGTLYMRDTVFRELEEV